MTTLNQDLADMLAAAAAHGIEVVRSSEPDAYGRASITFARPEDVVPFLNLITTDEAPTLSDLWTYEGQAWNRAGDNGDDWTPDHVLHITVTFPAKDLPSVAENARGKPTPATT